MASKFKQAEKQKRDVWCRRLVSAYLPGLQVLYAISIACHQVNDGS